MDSISPTSRDLARRLLAKEAARAKNSGTGTSTTPVPPAVRVCDKLRTVLVTFAGIAGFRSLLTRALTLSAARMPELKGVTVQEDGSLSGFENIASSKKKNAVEDWEEMLVGKLLDLLVTFVGETLMLQLVSQAWPNLLANQIRSSFEDQK